MKQRIQYEDVIAAIDKTVLYKRDDISDSMRLGVAASVLARLLNRQSTVADEKKHLGISKKEAA